MKPLLAELEINLTRQVELQESLREVLRARVEAIRGAEHDAVRSLCHRENELVQQIAELEKQRLELAARWTQAIDPQAPEPMRLTALAQHLTEPDRSRLLVLRAKLRDRMQQTQREVSVASGATDVLMRHMQGLMQTIGGLMSGVTTYGRHGTLPKQATVSTLNLTA